ncbi:MAG: NADH:ubiquinone reductase (Na(+)-transporting) subunit C [Crocinitomicaceae bacterium]|nr:NADH:ubiquinone reductase (Na(+)-transporting) subunit C [Crocinitomicaceae bacterium]
MAVNRDSNGYTFAFAITLVVVVGAILASIAMWTKPYKNANDEVKKKMDILKALLPSEEANDISRKNAAEEFVKYVNMEDAVVLDMNGNVLEGEDAFSIDIKKQYRDKKLKAEEKKYPLFVATNKEGKKSYVIPVVGTGLWGPIWGNICLAEDMKTIQGATFDHKTETPGLGAEIKQAFFIKGWIGEEVSDENGFKKFEVVKDNSGALPSKIDGITGGTITSKGVEEMANRCLEIYVSYFNNLKK